MAKVQLPRVKLRLPGKLIIGLLKFPIVLGKTVLKSTIGKIITAIVLLGAIGVGSYYGYRNWQHKQWLLAVDYYRRADYNKAGEYLAKAPVPTKIDDLRIYGQTMFAIGKYDKARAAYQKVSEQDSDPFSKLMIGNIASQQKDYAKAIGVYNSLIDGNPNYIQAYANLGMLYHLQGQKDEAIAVAKKGIDHNPNSVVMYSLLLTVTFQDKNSEEFKLAVDKLKALDPQNALLAQIQ